MNEPNLDWTQIVSDRKVKEGMDAGEFDDIPGMGKPVDVSADPYTPAHLRIANKVLRNANTLPEWMQLEKDIQREIAAVRTGRERGLNAIRIAKNAASRERAAIRLRLEHKDRISVLNTMILKYCFAAPATAQQPFATFNIKADMAALEEAINSAMTASQQEAAAAAAPKPRRRLW